MIKKYFGIVVLVVTLIGAVTSEVLAIPEAVSSFKEEEIKALVGDEILGRRVRVENRSTAMVVETCFLLDGKPKDVRSKVRKWNPSIHDEIGVLLHQPIGKSITANSFKGLKLKNAKRQGAFILEGVEELRSRRFSLNLSSIEANDLFSVYEKNGRQIDLSIGEINQVWKSILVERAQDFRKGGLNKLFTYDNSGRSTSISTELKKVIKGVPGLVEDFDPILRKIIVGGGSPEFYYEKILINGDMALLVGGYLEEKLGGGVCLADMQFYVSHTIYGTLILYLFEPFAEDPSQTLVWRMDTVLTPPLVTGGGMERMASANVLLQEVKKVVKFLRKDLK